LRLVNGLAAVLREEEIDNFLRARQAANVSGQDAIGTQLHGSPH
jgi:hypothetical protein